MPYSVKVNGRNGGTASPALEEKFREGDERIFNTHGADLGDRWILAVFTAPEARRYLRHRIRIGLIRMRFGSVAPRMWIGPEHLRAAAQVYVDGQGSPSTSTGSLETAWWHGRLPSRWGSGGTCKL